MCVVLVFRPFTRKEKNKRTHKVEIDFHNERKEHYVVNRDSAYADPNNKINGWKRFVEGKQSNHDKI
jgi:carbonic anhydrase